MDKPFWLMMKPYAYYKFRRQSLVNWLDRHTHFASSRSGENCHYCNQNGDELWWYLPTCRAQNWHIKHLFDVQRGVAPPNPYRRAD